MTVVHSEVNSDHCSTSTKQTQHLGGQRIQRVFRLQRMANRPSNDSAFHQRVHHSLCSSRLTALLPQYACQLETRPRRYLHRRDDPGLGSSIRLRLSTVQSDFSSPGIPFSGSGLSGASVAGTCTALVTSPSGSPDGEPCNDPQLQAPPKRPCSPSMCTPDVPQAPPSRSVYHISGKITKQKAFQRTLPKYSCQPLSNPLIKPTSHPGEYGVADVVNGKLIRF